MLEAHLRGCADATALNSVVVHAIELPISGLRCHTIEHVDLAAKTGMILEEAIVLGAGVVLSKKVETGTQHALKHRTLVAPPYWLLSGQPQVGW